MKTSIFFAFKFYFQYLFLFNYYCGDKKNADAANQKHKQKILEMLNRSAACKTFEIYVFLQTEMPISTIPT